MGEVISLSVRNRRVAMPRRSRDRLRRLALLTPSWGGHAPTAKRASDPRARHRPKKQEEWLDLNDPNQRGHLSQSVEGIGAATATDNSRSRRCQPANVVQRRDLSNIVLGETWPAWHLKVH